MQVGRDLQLGPDARAAADEGGLAVGNAAGRLLIVMVRVGEVVRRRTTRSGGSQVVRHGGAVAHLDAVLLGTALARLDVGPAIFRTFPWGVKEEEAPKKGSKWMLHCSPLTQHYLSVYFRAEAPAVTQLNPKNQHPNDLKCTQKCTYSR